MNLWQLKRGINKAKISLVEQALYEPISNSICFFISYRRDDKQAAREISNYINKAGFSTYFDEDDDCLSSAIENYNSKAITACIQLGLNQSSHIICIVSNKTKESWWVPYEIGYATKCESSILTLKLKGDYILPDYLKISHIILGTKSLNEYLQSLIKRHLVESIYSDKIFQNYLTKESTQHHPLDPYLDWDM
jgi:hypothetical protein